MESSKQAPVNGCIVFGECQGHSYFLLQQLFFDQVNRKLKTVLNNLPLVVSPYNYTSYHNKQISIKSCNSRDIHMEISNNHQLIKGCLFQKLTGGELGGESSNQAKLGFSLPRIIMKQKYTKIPQKRG